MSDHDPLCPMALSRRAKRCTCMELHKRDTRVRADERINERAKWLKWAARNSCCEAGLVAAPDPCPWHPDGVRERIAQEIERYDAETCVPADERKRLRAQVEGLVWKRHPDLYGDLLSRDQVLRLLGGESDGS